MCCQGPESWKAASAWQRSASPETKSGCPESRGSACSNFQRLRLPCSWLPCPDGRFGLWTSMVMVSPDLHEACNGVQGHCTACSPGNPALSVLRIWLKTMYRAHVETPQWTQPSQQVGGFVRRPNTLSLRAKALVALWG